MATILIGLLLLSLAQRIGFALASLSKRHRPSPAGELPTIQVFVAARNEEVSLPRLLEALERLDYDPARLSFVFVSDGSTDATVALMEAWCEGRDRAITIALANHGGKTAALQTAWKNAPGAELTALYDADVEPRPSALRLLAPEFMDAAVGAATGAVLPSNFDVNMVTRYAALELWVFHQVIQAARDRLGLNPPAVGAHSVYRSAALQDVGGFPTDGNSEDVETSFAVLRRGWRTSFRIDAVVTTEVPQSRSEFWGQRERWTRGLYQSIRRAPSLAAVLVAIGYVDRLIFLAVAVGAAWGSISWLWPALYFTGPALNICVALARVGVPAKIKFVCGAIPMFAVDLGVTVVGTLKSLNSFSSVGRTAAHSRPRTRE